MQKYIKPLMWFSFIVTILLIISVNQVVSLLDAQGVVYAENTEPVSCPTLAEQLETRAHEIREENKDYDLERYRHEAIREININLQKELGTSPFVDMEELKNK